MASKDDRRLLGGTGPTHPADDSVQALADNVSLLDSLLARRRPNDAYRA